MAKQEQAANDKEFKQGEQASKSLSTLLNQKLKLKKESFELLGEIFGKEITYLDPKKPAYRNTFLGEEANKNSRTQLKETLSNWIEKLQQTENIAEVISKCDEEIETTELSLNQHKQHLLEQTRDLETSYRTVESFFKNTGLSRVPDVEFVNAHLHSKFTDNTYYKEEVEDQLAKTFEKVRDKIDFTNSKAMDYHDHYSMLVVPGYNWEQGSVLREWANLAYTNKVTLITDYENVDSLTDVIDSPTFKHAGDDVELANVIMTCNWLVGRGKHTELNEEEDLYLPPSASLAGRLYQGLPSQPVAGGTHGGLLGVDGVRHKLNIEELGLLGSKGLVPFTFQYNKVIGFSSSSLNTSDSPALQNYSVVRVIDWVNKCMHDYLNYQTFRLISPQIKTRWREQIMRNMTYHQGPGRLFEEFRIEKFEEDKNNPTKMNIKISIKPYFPAKTFMLDISAEDTEQGGDGLKTLKSTLT